MLGAHRWAAWSSYPAEGREHEIHVMFDQRLDLILLFVAFLGTFLVTRGITRLIRAGKGPFRDNVAGGVHIHHAVPGIILTIIGGVSSVGSAGHTPGAEISAILIGIGASLVLDEFALILHLQDVYWSKEGQLSVQVVALTATGLGLLVLGFQPFSNTESPSTVGRVTFFSALAIQLICLLVCVAKGKYSTAVIGAFVPVIAWWGAIRLGRPRSRWAKRYSPKKLARATKRSARFDKRWGAWGLNLEDLVAGTPATAADPAANIPAAPTSS